MQELIVKFGINWKILLAQAANFAVLFFILSKFVYRPVLALLKERRERIEKGLELTTSAERKMTEIEVLKSETLNKAQQDSLGIIRQGEEKGKVREVEIIQDAQSHAEKIISQGHTTVEREREAMHSQFYTEATDLVRSVVTAVLGKTDMSKEENVLIESTLNELKKS